MFYTADVSDRGEVDALVERVHADLGPLWIACSNAGVADWQPWAEITEDSFDRIVAVNLTGAFNVGQAAARAMVANEKGGRIVFTSSVHVRMCFPSMAVYGATKQGVRALAETMAIELGRPRDHGQPHRAGLGEVAAQRSLARPAARRRTRRRRST